MGTSTAALSLRDRIVHRFAEKVGPERLQRYFGGSVRVRCGAGAVQVSVPNAFLAEWMGRRYGAELRDLAREETGDDGVELMFEVDDDDAATAAMNGVNGAHAEARAQTEAGDEETGGGVKARVGPRGVVAQTSAAGQGASPDAPARLPHGRGGPAGRTGAIPPHPAPAPLRADGAVAVAAGAAAIRGARSRGGERMALKHSLDDFVVGPGNELAHHAALSLIDSAPGDGLSPLFIHGECGLGKTHLLQGLAARYLEAHPGSRVRYTTGEAYTNAYIAAIKKNRVDDFRRAYRSLDLLCIDDVHFLSNKNATQGEFLHTFDAIGMEGARIALASDEHPSRIRQFSRELVSRFVAGMVAGLERPDRETRLKIARRIAQRRGMPMEESALQIVAARCAGSVRDVEGGLNLVDAMWRLVGRPGGTIDAALAQRALGAPAAARRPTRPIRVEAIATKVCSELGVEMADMMGSGRHKRLVLARSMTSHLSRRLTTLSYPEIARAMARTNHSSVITQCQRVEDMIKSGAPCNAGPEFDGLSVEELAERLAGEIVREGERG